MREYRNEDLGDMREPVNFGKAVIRGIFYSVAMIALIWLMMSFP